MRVVSCADQPTDSEIDTSVSLSSVRAVRFCVSIEPEKSAPKTPKGDGTGRPGGDNPGRDRREINLRQRRPFDDRSVVGRILLDDLSLVDVAVLDHLL